MNEALILTWAIPAALVSIGIVFFILNQHTPGLLWWGIAYSTAAVGFAMTMIPVGEFKVFKAVAEDTLFLFALMAMARGISLRFGKCTHDVAVTCVLVLSAGAATVALAVYDSVPAEIFFIQSGCAVLQLFTAWQMRGHLRKPINRVLCTLCVAFASSLILQNVAFLLQPAANVTIDDWHQSEWAFAFQAGSALFGLLFAFTAVIAISLDKIEKLRLIATTDLLSGVLNRRGFEEAAEAVLAMHRRRATVILVDIDHFKRVNDGFGHAAGDAVIARFGRLLSGAVYDCGPVARIGGEEFAILLPATRLHAATMVAEALREAFEDIEWHGALSGLRVTASLGVAEMDPGEALDATLARADECLYRAKEGGRNRVVATAAEPAIFRAAA